MKQMIKQSAHYIHLYMDAKAETVPPFETLGFPEDFSSAKAWAAQLSILNGYPVYMDAESIQITFGEYELEITEFQCRILHLASGDTYHETSIQEKEVIA